MTMMLRGEERFGYVDTPAIIRSGLRKAKTFKMFSILMAEIGMGPEDSRYWWDKSREPAIEDMRGEK